MTSTTSTIPDIATMLRNSVESIAEELASMDSQSDFDAEGSGSGWMRIHPAKLLHCTVKIDRLRRYDDDNDE